MQGFRVQGLGLQGFRVWGYRIRTQGVRSRLCVDCTVGSRTLIPSYTNSVWYQRLSLHRMHHGYSDVSRKPCKASGLIIVIFGVPHGIVILL